MRVLHVDSENARHLEMVLSCQRQEIVVHFAEDGDEAISILVRDSYDTIVIAPELADFDGVALVRRLRACRVSTPILLLGRSTTPEFRASCLWAGADDVMDLPWNGEELVARMRSLARRAHGHAHSLIKLGPLVVDQEQMRVVTAAEGRVIPITEKEYLILELLATRVGRVCSKDQIMNHLYGGGADDEPEEKIIDVFVCKLRKKLGEHGILISTVWGRGYIIKSSDVSPARAVA